MPARRFPDEQACQAANRAAEFHPIAQPDSLPCMELAGVLVFAYLDPEDRALCVSIHLDSTDDWLVGADDTVPLRVAVNDTVVFDDAREPTTDQEPADTPRERRPMVSAHELWFVDEQWLHDLYDPATGGTRRGTFCGYAAAGRGDWRPDGRILVSRLALEVIAGALDSIPEARYRIARDGGEFLVVAATGESYRLRPDGGGGFDVSGLPWTWVEVDPSTPVLEAW